MFKNMDLNKKIWLAGDALIVLAALPLFINFDTVSKSSSFVFTSGFTGTTTMMNGVVFMIFIPLFMLFINTFMYVVLRNKFKWNVFNIGIPILVAYALIWSFLNAMGII